MNPRKFKGFICKARAFNDIVRLLLLQSNDVEVNPGPHRTTEHLEKALNDLYREVRAMGKVIEQQAVTIQNMSRNQQRMRVEDNLGTLNQDVYDLREMIEAQGSLVKRQRADMTAMNYEVATVKKLNQNMRKE